VGISCSYSGERQRTKIVAVKTRDTVFCKKKANKGIIDWLSVKVSDRTNFQNTEILNSATICRAKLPQPDNRAQGEEGIPEVNDSSNSAFRYTYFQPWILT
jgi:hypothetical protein